MKHVSNLPPLMGLEFESLIRSLQDTNQRDDLKLKALQEICASYEVFCSSPSYSILLDNLVKVFMKMLMDTTPQFIAENNTHMLRKQILEILLRTASHEAVKPHAKDLTKTLLRLIGIDNEENAILGIKIVTEMGKSGKMQFVPEISGTITFCKQIMKDLGYHVNSGMFLTKDLALGRSNTGNLMDETLIETYLQSCFYTQPVNLNPNAKLTGQGQETKYTIIPRAQQSVKIVQELSMFFVFIYQHYKNSILNECLEFLQLCIQFAGYSINPEVKEHPQFNRTLADEFYTSQTKSLCFVSIMGKVPQFMEVIQQNSVPLLTAMLCLLENIPSDLVIVRKDALMTLKFCFSTDLKNKFVPLLPRLLDEEALLGTGFTAVDHLRVFLYQMLADLLHHMRNQLTFPMLLHTTSVFSRTMNDNSITFQVQIMCVRLLNSVCETMPKMEQQGEATRDLLLIILENLIIKLKRIAVYHLPLLCKQHGIDIDQKPCTRREKDFLRPQPLTSSSSTVSVDERDRIVLDLDHARRCSLDTVAELEPIKKEDEEVFMCGPSGSGADPNNPDPNVLPPPTKTGRHSTPEQIMALQWPINNPELTVAEARNLVKYVMQTCKYCTAQLVNTRRSNASSSKAKERDLFERLLKYGIQCMDVFVLPFQQPPSARGSHNSSSSAGSRSKDEKDALDSFATLFTSIDSDVYRELFAKYIDFLVERIHRNMSLQLIINTFLVRADWSCKFGSIMLKYLMDKMSCLSVSNEKTGLYVKLFKIIFSAIGCSQPQSSPDGELMLKPYLPDLIRKSTEYALSAREPLNYFLLLRALFRSIGGGAHDILYGQFLPLLPNLLQFLNKLQSCPHRQQMRELFLELCLTVPVRLSSLLPYLPLLMDPLVCALNGSTSLVQQGLRTLELCVDNLQPEYLFEHMAPVRGALMQGLWKVLGTSTESTSAAIAFRILGKFGGANRRMLNEPQMLKSVTTESIHPSVLRIEFPRFYDDAISSVPYIAGDLALTEIMHVAVEQMRVCATTPEPSTGQGNGPSPAQNLYVLIRQHCMELARAVLLTSLGPRNTSDDWKAGLIDGLKEQFKRLQQIPDDIPVYKCAREGDRIMIRDALVVLFIGVGGKDLRHTYLKFFSAVTRQLTIHSLLECSGREHLETYHLLPRCLDGGVLVDALVTVLSDSNKDFLHAAIVTLSHINETCKIILPDCELMSRVPLVRYLLDQVTTLCYGPSWFARLGGASALAYIIENFPPSLVRKNQSRMVEGLCEIIVGLVDEISSGAVEMAVGALRMMQKLLLEDYSLCDDDGRVSTFVRYYRILLFHGSPSVRSKVITLLDDAVSIMKDTTIAALLEKHADLLSPEIDCIIRELAVMSMSQQSASLAIVSYILCSAPSMLVLEEDDPITIAFLDVVLDLCETDVAILSSRNNYKTAENCPAHFLPPYPISQQMESLRSNAIQAVIAFFEVFMRRSQVPTKVEHMDTDDTTEQTITVGYPSVLCSRIVNLALSEMLKGSETMKKSAEDALKRCAPIPLEILRPASEDIITRILRGRELQAEDVFRLNQLVRLNSALFDKEIALALSVHIGHWYSPGYDEDEFPSRSPEDVEGVHLILQMLIDSDAVNMHMVSMIFSSIAFFEANYCIDTPSTWLPMLCELMSRWPTESLAILLSDETLTMEYRYTILRRIFKDPKSRPLGTALCDDPIYFDSLLDQKAMDINGLWKELPASSNEEISMQREETAIKLLDTVTRENIVWFSTAHELVGKLRNIWNSDKFRLRYNVNPSYEDAEKSKIKVHSISSHKYNVPRLYVNCFIRYLRKNREDYDLLFDMLYVFDNHYATDFCFVKDWLEQEVIPCYSLSWRRNVFNLLLEKFETEPSKWQKNITMAKIIQYLLIPCLHWAFERYDVCEILGSALSDSEQVDEDPMSLVSRLAKVLDDNRQQLGDNNVIVFYQLCTLLVEQAPQHIHNNACKKQGGRLRVFMLFAWPCLTPNSHSDPTLRFTGFLFLAHIIDKFTINRKIVLQVFNILAQSYQLDNRDQVKRAVDILTPAVPIRMDDGHQQMLTYIKKILLEETHNLQHVQHVVQMIIRNYRVYYFVRHDLMSPLMHSIQRVLHMPNGLMEGLSARRLALDVCEMIIKWDLLRNQKLEKGTSQEGQVEDSLEVETVLEALKSSDKDDKDKDNQDGSSQTSSQNSTLAAKASSSTHSWRSESNLSALNLGKDDQVNKPIAKDQIDQVINILMKFATTIPAMNQPQQYAAATVDMGKRSLGLLKAALKPAVWGETATMKFNWLEKQITLSPDLANARPDAGNQASQQLAQAQQSLDVLVALAPVMPKTSLLQVMRPVQRAIISCLNCSYTHLVRTVNCLVGRLFERTKSSATGIDELEIFNQYISKYLNDQFMNYYKAPNSVVQQVFTSFSLLRAICAQQPGYIDAMCLSSFIKVLEKAVREHAGHIASGQDGNREKGVAELISIALELVRPRIDVMLPDIRRAFCQNVLLPLIDRSTYDKVIESLIKITQELVLTHKDESSANPGLPLSVRIHGLMEKRFRVGSCNPLMSTYLGLVLVIFETSPFRDSDYADRMEDAFYWGLMSSDPVIREKFLRVWDQKVDRNVFRRLMFILRDHNWTPFRDHYWIRHAIWLCLRCIPVHHPDAPRKRVFFNDCATFWRTLEASGVVFCEDTPSLGAINMGSAQSSRSTPSGNETETTPMEVDGDNRLDVLLAEQQKLMCDASSFDFTSIVESVSGLIFNLPDTSFVASIWSRLFNSLWADMTGDERQECACVLEAFMCSGVHNQQMGSPHSVLKTWIDTLNKSHPPVHLPPRLIQFIGSRHQSWHLGTMMLENQVIMMNSRMLNNDLAMNVQIDSNTQLHLDVLDYLASMYKDLSELDQFAAVWDRRAIKQDTLNILHKMQSGDTKDAFHMLEHTLVAVGEQISIPGNEGRLGPAMDEEIQLLYDTYATCCQELMEWDKLRDFCNSGHVQNPRLLMLAGMHLPDWGIVRECREQLSGCIPPNFINSFNIYTAMLTVMNTQDGTDPLAVNSKLRMDRAVDDAVQSHIAYWRTLPSIVSNAHVKVLQAMNMIREVADCTELKATLDASGVNFNGSVINEMKAVIKIWRNRAAAVSDELSFITGMYDWRCQVHQLVVKKFEEWERVGTTVPHGTNVHNILPMHSAAQGQVVIAKAARNMRLFDISCEQLHKLNTIVAVPMMDAHQKICEHIKTLRAQSEYPGIDPKEKIDLLQLGLHLIDSTTVTDFHKDFVCKFFTLKGTLLSSLDKREEALKAFSVAAQLYEGPSFGSSNSMCNVFKAWGNHMDKIFHNDKNELSGLTAGAGAIACYLEAARSESEPKAKKYIARLLWTAKHMVACGQNSATRLDEQIMKHERTTVAYNWLSWLPQIISDIRYRPQSALLAVLNRISAVYPLQVFYALRSALPISVTDAVIAEVCMQGPMQEQEEPRGDAVLIPVLRSICQQRSCDVKVFHRFLHELSEMKEFWAERQLRFASQMKDEIFRCLHAQRMNHVNTQHLDDSAMVVVNSWLNDISTLPFERVIAENSVQHAPDEDGPPSSESLFIQESTAEIVSALSSLPQPGQLHRFMETILKINHKLHKRLSKIPRRIALHAASSFLPAFNHRNACIEMPSDLLNVLKTGQYVSMISRVEPHIIISIQGGQVVRRISIRAQTGKTCTYYVRRSFHSNGGIDRCQPFLASLNTLLAKERDTCQRHLSVHVPVQLCLGDHATLVEMSVANTADTNANGPPAIYPMELLGRAILPLGMRPDDVIAMFYDRLLLEGDSSPENRMRVFRDLTMDELVSNSILVRHLMQHYPDPTHYYMLRKQVARHVAVLSVVEWICKLTPVGLGDMFIHRSTGQLANPNYAFDIRNIGVERPVPFRMTPNMHMFLGFAMGGDVHWSAFATARCLLFRKPEVMLRPLFWDHVVANCSGSSKEIFAQANNYVNLVISNTKKLCCSDAASTMDDMAGLMARARHDENLCAVDPALHPWF